MVEPLEILTADMPQVASQLISQRIAIALGRFKALVIHLPILLQNIRKRNAVIVTGEVFLVSPVSPVVRCYNLRVRSCVPLVASERSSSGKNLEDRIIQINQFGFRCGEKDPRDVLRVFVKLHAEQITSPF